MSKAVPARSSRKRVGAPVAITSAMRDRRDAARSSGKNAKRSAPSSPRRGTSSRSAAVLLAARTVPAASTRIADSAVAFRYARMFSSLARSASTARLRSVMSQKVPNVPANPPAASKRGVAATRIVRRSPSGRRISSS